MYDTIIIGAGMSGLAAGIRLAYYDRRVCILERHYTIGGLNSFYRLNGRNHDVGLHAVTNYSPRGAHRGPLARMLRQLRFRFDDFDLAPQIGSAIKFPGVQLEFGNGVELLESQIAEKFPDQQEPFRRLLERLLGYDDLDHDAYLDSARGVLAETLTDPLLAEMLLAPCMWYGNAREHDMDFGAFCMLFRSIFLEGLARPWAGVRLILRNLVRRYRALGGELRLRSGVQRIKVDGGRAVGVVLDDGREIEARTILSSAGAPETMRMCDDAHQLPRPPQSGQLSFVETVSVFDRPPKELGYDRTMVFYNDSPVFHWHRPTDELCDVRSAVMCSPNNFHYDPARGEMPDLLLRVTTLADHGRWMSLSDDEYRLEKLRWYDRIHESATRFVPDYRNHVIDTDMFTPRTIRRFTWRDNGAIYGSPDKQLRGKTHLENLYLCGTDNGFVGIMGAILSGIAVTNKYLLRD